MATQFAKREAVKAASQQAKAETEKFIRDAADAADRLGTLTVDEETATVWLDGIIGQDVFGEVDAKAVRDAMRTLKGRQVTFRINSEGGSVDAGLEIYNVLKEHRGGLVTRANLAASMAGIIFQSGGRRIMEPTGMLMIHAPHARGGGNAGEHTKMAEILKKYAERVVPILAGRSGKSEDAIRTLLETETWYLPAEAVKQNFADEIAVRQTTGRPKLAKARRALIRSRVESSRMETDAIVASYGD